MQNPRVKVVFSGAAGNVIAFYHDGRRIQLLQGGILPADAVQPNRIYELEIVDRTGPTVDCRVLSDLTRMNEDLESRIREEVRAVVARVFRPSGYSCVHGYSLPTFRDIGVQVVPSRLTFSDKGQVVALALAAVASWGHHGAFYDFDAANGIEEYTSYSFQIDLDEPLTVNGACAQEYIAVVLQDIADGGDELELPAAVRAQASQLIGSLKRIAAALNDLDYHGQLDLFPRLSPLLGGFRPRRKPRHSALIAQWLLAEMQGNSITNLQELCRHKLSAAR